MSYQDRLTTCEHCGGEYGWYTTGQMQHYCPRLGFRRLFRDEPSEGEREAEARKMRDPAYQRAFFDLQNERSRR